VPSPNHFVVYGNKAYTKTPDSAFFEWRIYVFGFVGIDINSQVAPFFRMSQLGGCEHA